nr:MAG TPA: hypothetical protein [Caudoviricetes sp.]
MSGRRSSITSSISNPRICCNSPKSLPHVMPINGLDAAERQAYSSNH